MSPHTQTEWIPLCKYLLNKDKTKIENVCVKKIVDLMINQVIET